MSHSGKFKILSLSETKISTRRDIIYIPDWEWKFAYDFIEIILLIILCSFYYVKLQNSEDTI